MADPGVARLVIQWREMGNAPDRYMAESAIYRACADELAAALAAPQDAPPAEDRCSECGEPRPCRAARRLAHPHEEQP